jgi:Family of unknown function (DUF6492)
VSTSVAFVTPSYRLDRDRCALLNRSLDACAPSFEHWIVVDRGDLPLFRSLQNNRTNVVAKEEVLPVWVRRLDTLRIGLRSNVWVQARGRPIRGWLLQQMVKLAVAEQLSADVLVHADSDVVLVRPFSAASVVDGGGRVRLYARPDCIDEALPDHVGWHRSAEKLLDIGPAGLPTTDFISSLVPWRRENATALLEHIEATTGRHWLRAVAAAWDVSEYTLYGRFASDVLGTSGGQFVSSSPLCMDYYKRVPLTAPELTTFLDRLGQETVAISLTSKAGMKPEDYVDVLERQWASPASQESHNDAHPERRRDEGGGAATAVAEGGTARDVGRPAGERGPPLATESQVGSASRRGRVIKHAARAGMTVGVVALLAAMTVLFGLGSD